MIFYMKTIFYLLFLPFSICSSHDNFQRKVVAVKNPGCVDKNAYSCNFSVYYVNATSENDTIHYLWDFSNEPSLLLVHTDLKNRLTINWDKFNENKSNAIYFNRKPNYSFLVILHELLEFNDTDDTGFITDQSKNISYKLDQFHWSVSHDIQPISDSTGVMIEFLGSNFTNSNQSLTGDIKMQLSAYGSQSHDDLLPRLLHSANSSQGKIELRGLTSNSGFSHSRWALELMFVTSDLSNETLGVQSKKNLDDENSPGVFSIYNIVSPWSENLDSHLHGAFLQWRPVVYTAATPSIGNSSDVAVMDPMYIDSPKSVLNRSLADKYFGKHLKNCLVQRTYVSFGTPQDGFYKKTNYSSWAFLLSYGSPQTEGFSMLIILVMSIGLGLPALLILGGGIFICVRRYSRNADELSLDR